MNETKCSHHTAHHEGIWGLELYLHFPMCFHGLQRDKFIVTLFLSGPYKTCPTLQYKCMCAVLDLLLSSAQNFFLEKPWKQRSVGQY